MENTVLLVVDMQNALVEANPFNEATVLKNVKKLIYAAREKNIEVIYVRHDGGVDEELTNYYEQKIWHNRFAAVAPLDHVLGRV